MSREISVTAELTAKGGDYSRVVIIVDGIYCGGLDLPKEVAGEIARRIHGKVTLTGHEPISRG